MRDKKKHNRMLISLTFLLMILESDTSAFEEEDVCFKKERCAFPDSEKNCHCDEDCHTFNDCCIDVDPQERSRKSVRYTCQELYPLGGIYSVSQCDTSWKGDAKILEKCVSPALISTTSFISLPVTNSLSGRIFRNYHCALCNQNKRNISFWSASLKCYRSYLLELFWESEALLKKVLDISPQAILMRQENGSVFRCSTSFVPFPDTHLRRCIPYVVHDCEENWPFEDIRLLCRNHTGYRISRANVVFRNKYCTICNNASVSNLSCSVTIPQNTTPEADANVNPRLNQTFPLKEVPCRNGNTRNLFDARYFSIKCKTKYSYVPTPRHKLFNYVYNRYRNFYYNYLKWYDIILKVKVSQEYLFCEPLNATMANGSLVFVYKNGTNIESLNCHRLHLEIGETIVISDSEVKVVSRKLILRETSYVINQQENNVYVISCSIFQNYVQPVPEFLYVCLVTFIVQLLIISCLTLHILSFLCFKGNKSIFDYNVFSLVLSYFGRNIFVTFSDSHLLSFRACHICGLIFYFFMMSYLLWVTVIGFDVLRSIHGSITKLQRPSEEMEWRRFFGYSLYAWMIPAALVTVIVVMDEVLPKGATYKPEFGVNRCWFGNIQARKILFIVPNSIASVLIFLFFVTIAAMIIASRSSSPSSSKSAAMNHGNLKQKLLLFMKLSCLVGLTKILYVIADRFREDDGTVYLKFLFKMTGTFLGILILSFTPRYSFYLFFKRVFITRVFKLLDILRNNIDKSR